MVDEGDHTKISSNATVQKDDIVLLLLKKYTTNIQLKIGVNLGTARN